MTEKRKKLLKWVGYPLLAWTTFIFAVHFTFPYDRVRDRIIEALSKDFDVSILAIRPGLLPGRVTIEGLTLTTHPKRDDDKPRTLTLERVDLSLGVLALLGRTVSVDIDAKLGGGRLVGNVRQSSSGINVDLRTEDVSLESVPGLDVITGGAPIVGPFAAKVKLNLPKGKWAGSTGGLEVSCSGCTIGDGVTKVRPMNPGQQNAFTSEGMTLPRIRLGEFGGKIQINKGVACIERFDARGGDIELTLEGGVKLSDPFKDSQAQLQARLKSSEEFRKASVRNSALFTGTRDAEGYTAYTAKNAPLVAMRWLESRTAFTQMPECRGVAAPPSPSTAKPIARGTAPQNPVPSPSPSPSPGPVGTATANPPPTAAGGTPPAPSVEPTAPPPSTEPVAQPQPPTPQNNDLVPSATPPIAAPEAPPAPPPAVEVVQQPETQPPPPAENPPPPVQEQPQPIAQ